MTQPGELEHLIRLLDDESEIVRGVVVERLASYGPSLEDELRRQHISLSAHERKIMDDLVSEGARAAFQSRWRRWFQMTDDKAMLESALGLIAEYQLGSRYPFTLSRLLDDLATEYTSTHKRKDARSLARFLFKKKNLGGAPQDDFNNPLNSNLIYVIQQRKGLPISLSCVFILVGKRIGLEIEGCNLPGHFLTTAMAGNKKVLVDCYLGGIFIDDEILARADAGIQLTVEDLLKLECDAPVIIARFLRNLIHAYEKSNDLASMKFMMDLSDLTAGRKE